MERGLSSVQVRRILGQASGFDGFTFSEPRIPRSRLSRRRLMFFAVEGWRRIFFSFLFFWPFFLPVPEYCWETFSPLGDELLL